MTCFLKTEGQTNTLNMFSCSTDQLLYTLRHEDNEQASKSLLNIPMSLRFYVVCTFILNLKHTILHIIFYLALKKFPYKYCMVGEYYPFQTTDTPKECSLMAAISSKTKTSGHLSSCRHKGIVFPSSLSLISVRPVYKRSRVLIWSPCCCRTFPTQKEMQMWRVWGLKGF